MRVSWTKQAFVFISIPIMIAATQMQSCAAADPPADQAATGGAPPGTGATGGGGGGVIPYDGGGSPPNPGETRVAIIQSPVALAAQLDQNEINRMVGDAVALAGGFEGLIQEGYTVVLKPNLVQPNDFTRPNWAVGEPLTPEVNGVCTDYRVVRAVAALVRQYNQTGPIYVMEGTAGPTTTAEVFAALNYTPQAIPEVTAFLPIETDSAEPGGVTDVAVTGGLLGSTYSVNTKYLNANVLISIPTLKTHYQAAVTGAVKNVGIGATPANVYGDAAANFGNPLLRMTMVDHYSIALHHWIHDYYMARPVNFAVVDGLQGIQNGPTPSTAVSGTTAIAQDQMNMRLIMAGADSVAVDTIGALVMGWDPATVEYLRALNASGAGTAETASIRVLGYRVDMVRRQFAGPVDQLAYGGSPVADVTPPQVTVLSSGVSDGHLNLALVEDPDLRKFEIYLNGQLIEPTVTGAYSTISLDVRHLAPGSYAVEYIGYDYYMNATVGALPAPIVL